MHELWGGRNSSNAYDNLDLGILAVPLTFDGFSVTPWAMFGMMGKNAARTMLAGEVSGSRDYVTRGLFPVTMATDRVGPNQFRLNRTYATMFWVGIPITIDAFDPFNFEFDFNYGYMSGFGRYDDPWARNPDGTPRRNDSRREGFVLKALAEYKTDWGVPGIFGWYSSGDNGNPRDGSERIPLVSTDTPDLMLSTFGFNGSPSVSGQYDGIFGNNSLAGTWGIGVRIRDMSFLEGLTHTLRVNFFGGTNDPSMAKAMLGKTYDPSWNRNDMGSFDFFGGNRTAGKGLYLTTQDYAIEVNFDTLYKIYDNLDMMVELGYIHLWLDQSRSVWGSAPAGAYGNAPNGIRGVSVTDALKAAVYFRYSF